MNYRLQQNLTDARADLIYARTRLAFARKIGPDCDVPAYEADVCHAIDRAWDAQCMAGGSL